jgi:SecD/SecF fusion protein
LSRHLVWRSIFVIGVVAGAIALALARPARLGLDLRGGTQIVLEAQDTELEQVDDDTVIRTLEVLRRRVDQLGVSEPSLQRSGDRRVLIELPGVTDPKEALEVIGRTAQLTFHPVTGVAGPNATTVPSRNDDGLLLPDEAGQNLHLAPAAMTGDAVGDAEAVVDQQTSGWSVSISFRGQGGDQWAQLTAEAACAPTTSPQRRVAIVLDEKVISSPGVAAEVECDVGISGGDTVITGDFSQEEAKELALLIRAGALPVPVQIVEQRTVGPTLGDAAIKASIQAAIIGGALTILYVIAYYRLLGLLAAFALLLYGLISYAMLLGIGATLTLPGMAGFVLAIGMAVDANVLVFERSKEEFAAGRTPRAATHDGFKKAWSAIVDSNSTTVLAAVILFFFATGAVRGFGLTLTVGVLASMFTALIVTRLLVELLMKNRRVSANPALLGMNVGSRLRHRFEDRPPDIMSRWKLWFAVSTGVLFAAVLGLVTQGLRFGLEFTGGRLIEYTADRPVDLDTLRSELADGGFPRAVVQESGDGNIAVRAPQLSPKDEDAVRVAVEGAAGPVEEVRDEFIGPSIGEELRRKAFIALGIGLGAQLLYLAIRFRWTYGAAACAALFHDVMILLGIFAWLGKEIDGVFIAALLTVIGYSINDSVVVFDRIREQRRARAKESLSAVANDAALQTVPRTINTGFGALFILFALYFLGGDTLTDFALALIVGIVIGTYSSVFTAAPLAVALEKISGTEEPATRPPAKSAQPVRAQVVIEDRTSLVPEATATKSPARSRAGSSKKKRRRHR